LKIHELSLDLYPGSIATAFEQLREHQALLPPKVPAFYKAKVEAEVLALGHREGPLYKTVYPTPEKISLRAAGEVADYIDDRHHIPLGTSGHFLHKYSNRVLFMPTSVCLGHCMYCFRQDMLEEQHELRQKQLETDLHELILYLSQHTEVEEIILSGGDPLMLAYEDLKLICAKLHQVPSLKHFRIHTRAPVFDPRSLSMEKVALLSQYQFRFVLHIVHPYELCETLLEKLKQAQKTGLRLYNQFPLLRGVNDHPEVLSELFILLDQNNIRNLSVFMPYPVLHSATYRIPFKRIQTLVENVQNNRPAWVHATRFCQDTPIGKVRLEQQIPSQLPNHIAFRRDGKIVHIPDFPEHLDRPGELKNLLWKRYLD